MGKGRKKEIENDGIDNIENIYFFFHENTGFKIIIIIILIIGK